MPICCCCWDSGIRMFGNKGMYINPHQISHCQPSAHNDFARGRHPVRHAPRRSAALGQLRAAYALADHTGHHHPAPR